MSNINTIAVSGNLTADPEVKELPSGTKVAKLRMAVNRSKKNPDGDGYVEEASYFDVECFGNFAGLIERKLRKGNAVSVTGRLEQQRWEKDGENRSKVVIIGNEIDSPSFFLKDEDVPAMTSGSSNSGQPAADQVAAAAAADDDIPF